MSLLLLPQSIVSDIIIRCLYQAEYAKGWELRRVCNVFNDEVLYAFFVLKLDLQSLGSTGTYLAYVRNSFLTMARLQAHLTTVSSDVPAWLANIKDSLLILRSKIELEVCSVVPSGHRRHRFPLFQTDSRVVSDDWASEAICGAVASYFDFWELNDHLSRSTDSANSEFLERSPTFWLFAAACYAGRLELLRSALKDLQVKLESMGGKGARDTSYLQYGLQGKGEWQLYYWKAALSPCLSIAARRGHAQLVHYLLECGFEVNAVSPQNSTALLAAVETRQVDVLEILLDSSREWERSGKHYDEAMVNAARIGDNTLQWKILMLLTDNNSRKMSQTARDSVFYWASKINNVALAKWAMSHGAIDMFNFVPDSTDRPTSLEIVVREGHTDIFRLIMGSMDSFVSVPERQRKQICRHACSSTWGGSNVEAFLALVKFSHMQTPEQAFIQAAKVDGASALIEQLVGHIDVQKTYWPHHSPKSHSIGARALYQAIRMLRPQNVEFLLQRGCRLQTNRIVRLRRSEERRGELDPTLRQRVEDMMAEHGCQVLLEPCGWRRRQR